jgi:serine/threonine-protein kinase
VREQQPAPRRRPRSGGSLVANRYRLDTEVARGGMGVVWRATDTKLGRVVALKTIAGDLDDQARLRFEREACAAARLDSTHVVQIHDYGLDDGIPFIVMEMLVGESLRKRLGRLGSLPLGDAASTLYQICKGLRAAHDEGLVHRDLKPGNVFLAKKDDVELVKLLDFGVVKARSEQVDHNLTQSGVLLGTPQYMSPEQARTLKRIDHRSDLWSTAVIAFRMLAGTNPFEGDTVPDVLLRICSDSVPRIHEHRPDLPEKLDAFFLRAFSRAPEERFQSASELARAFHDAVSGELGEEASLPTGFKLDAPPAPSIAPPDETAPQELSTDWDSYVASSRDNASPEEAHPADSITVGGTPMPATPEVRRIGPQLLAVAALVTVVLAWFVPSLVASRTAPAATFAGHLELPHAPVLPTTPTTTATTTAARARAVAPTPAPTSAAPPVAPRRSVMPPRKPRAPVRTPPPEPPPAPASSVCDPTRPHCDRPPTF